jgi:hypothetical protein
MEKQVVQLPDAASPLEGIYLLAVLMRGQLERLDGLKALLDAPAAEEAAHLEGDLRELHWRLRAVLAGPDPGPDRDGTRLALLEMAGMARDADPPSRVKGWLESTRRRHLLDELEQGLSALASLADQGLALFQGDERETEFKLVGQVAREHAPRLRQWRER